MTGKIVTNKNDSFYKLCFPTLSSRETVYIPKNGILKATELKSRFSPQTKSIDSNETDSKKMLSKTSVQFGTGDYKASIVLFHSQRMSSISKKCRLDQDPDLQ